MMAIFSCLSTLTQFIAAYGKTLELLEASYECWKHLDFVVGQINCPQVCGEFLQIFWELRKQRTHELSIIHEDMTAAKCI